MAFFVFWVFLAAPCSMWDLSSWIRDRTRSPALKVQSLNHWTAREVPDWMAYKQQTFISCHSSGGWEGQDQSAGRFSDEGVLPDS